MTLETWILFCVTELALCAIPGPGVLLIVSLSLVRGARAGVAATLGILVASIVYFLLAAMGLGAAMQASGEIFTAIKYAGAVYLVWLGGNLLWSAYRDEEASAIRSEGVSNGRAFWQGFVTHASNPKLLMFFAAILPQFVDPEQGFTGQVAVLGISALVIQTVVLLAYSWLSARAGRLAGARMVRGVRAAGGVLLIGAGAGLATITRQ